MYTEIPISSLGSLAYAEDDEKHILGVKAVQPVIMGGASLGRQSPSPSEAGDRHSVLYCCHVFECGNEVSVPKAPLPPPRPSPPCTHTLNSILQVSGSGILGDFVLVKICKIIQSYGCTWG